MSLLDPYSGPWTRETSRHLLRRAGFGIPPSRIEEIERLGREKAVEGFLEAARAGDETPAPDWLPEAESFREMREQMGEMSDEERRKLQNEYQRENRQAIQRLVLWWMKRMYESPAVLREKMTLFWHGHFAVSAEKVKSAALNYQLNETLRRRALGKFEPLVLEVAKSPAMIRYLDNDRNVKGQANENFARELMELFTIGIGNYTETDIKEGARAFTGWAFERDQFAFRARRHDDGRKRFLGEEGAFKGEDIVKIVLKQPEVAPFIARKIWAFFAYDEPEEALVAELAERFRSSGYDIAGLLSVIFNSTAFYSPRARWTQIKSPVHFLIALHGELETSTPRQGLIPQVLRLLGQVPFYPPNVKGWDYGRAWINSNTLLLRANIVNYLVNGALPELRDRPRPPAAERVTEPKDEAINREGEGAEMMDTDDGADDRPAKAPGIRSQKTRPPLDIVALLERLGGGTASGLLNAATEHFIGHPVSEEQRATLLDGLRDVKNLGSPRDISSADLDKVRGMLHLLLSTAEYQLC